MNTEIPPSDPLPPAQKSSLPVIALVLSLLGCCIVPGIAAIILALIAINNAKTQNQPRPGTAIAAIVIAALMMVFGVVAIVAGVKADREREDAANELRSKLSAKLTADSLDKQTACDLAKVYFLGVKKENVEELKCEGTLEDGAIARLADVTRKNAGDEETFTFCFAKAHRWYVVATPADGECPAEAPAVPGSKPSDEEAFQTQEETLREKAAQARAVALIDRFNERLEKLKDVINAGHEDGEKKCPAFKSETKASYVDADLVLGEDLGGKGWEMLSDKDWRAAMNGKASEVDRAEAIDDITRKGPLVVVFDADGIREWPVAEGSSYTMGAFDGYMTVVNLSSGEVVCDGKLDFESSDTVGGGIKLKGMPDKSTKDLIDDDFEEVFEKKATEKMKSMSKGKLKLGLTFLE